MKFVSKIMFAGCFIMALAACATQALERDFNPARITEGMSLSAVLDEMGPPRSEETVVMPGQNTPTRVLRYTTRVAVEQNDVFSKDLTGLWREGLVASQGGWLEKDLTVFIRDGQVVSKRYNERRVLKTQKDSRPSNNIIQIN